MQSQWKSNLIVGAFVLGILSVFLYFIMNYTNELGLFEAKAYLNTKFMKPEGLFAGSSVQLNNVKIGRVTRIWFAEDLKDKYVYVTMICNASDLERIGKDAEATIMTAGLLGDALINIMPGDPQTNGLIEDGGFIIGVEKKGLLDFDLEPILKKVDNIMTKLDEGGIEALSSTIKNASDITDQIKRGEGTLGMLLYDDALMKEINGVIDDLNKVVKRVNNGPGSVHSLVYKDDVGKVMGDLTRISKNLESVVSEIKDKDIAKKIDELAKNLAATSESLAKITKNIESGEGTIGALMSDPSLYEDIKVIMGGAKRSDALRYVIEYTIRQKQQEAEKQKKKAGQENQ